MTVASAPLQRSLLNMLKIGYSSITKNIESVPRVAHRRHGSRRNVHEWLTGATGVAGMSTSGSPAPRESQECPRVARQRHGSHRNVHEWLTSATGVTGMSMSGSPALRESQEYPRVAHQHHGSYRNVHEWITGTTGVTGMTTSGSPEPRESYECPRVAHQRYGSRRNVHRWRTGHFKCRVRHRWFFLDCKLSSLLALYYKRYICAMSKTIVDVIMCKNLNS